MANHDYRFASEVRNQMGIFHLLLLKRPKTRYFKIRSTEEVFFSSHTFTSHSLVGIGVPQMKRKRNENSSHSSALFWSIASSQECLATVLLCEGVQAS
jgi:hypothetical protein